MKPQKDSKGFLDQSIADLIDDGEVRKNLAAMPKKERAKHEKVKARQDARNGRRAVYDMDPDVKMAIADIAKAQKCSASNVAEIFLRYAIQAKLDLRQFRVPVKHPSFEYKLEWKE
jgi:hypothetical protein